MGARPWPIRNTTGLRRDLCVRPGSHCRCAKLRAEPSFLILQSGPQGRNPTKTVAPKQVRFCFLSLSGSQVPPVSVQKVYGSRAEVSDEIGARCNLVFSSPPCRVKYSAKTVAGRGARRPFYLAYVCVAEELSKEKLYFCRCSQALDGSQAPL